MKIDENNYDVLKKVEDITGIDSGVIWTDAENIEGYITTGTLYNTIEDLLTEYGVLEEKYQDLLEKIKKRLDEVEEHEFQIQMIDRWDDRDRLADTLLSREIKALKSFLLSDENKI